MALARLDVPEPDALRRLDRARPLTAARTSRSRTSSRAIGAHAAGKITDEELTELENHASPGAGACGGQFTANTMAMAFEVLGISPMGSSMVPAEDGKKGQVAEECGRLVRRRAGQRDLRPSQIITSESLENAIAGRRHDRRLDQRGAAPAGGGERGGRAARARRLRPDRLEDAAAVRPQARRPLRRHRPLPRRRRAARDPPPEGGRAAARGRDHRRPARRSARSPTPPRRPRARRSCGRVGDPIKPNGGFAILRGNLAPEGCVVKLSGHDRIEHRGPARVFESEEDAFAAVSRASRSSRATSS